jgi:uncharacterized protein (DUF169 family)
VIVGEDAYAHTVDVETARKLYTSIPMLPPENKAVLMGPLNELPVDPDVVLIVGNPAQMLKIVEAVSVFIFIYNIYSLMFKTS